jgi:hypothetical protein
MKTIISKSFLLLATAAGLLLCSACSLFIKSEIHYYSDAAAAPPKKVLPQIYDQPAGGIIKETEFEVQLNQKGYASFAWIDLDAPASVSDGDLRTKLIKEAAAAGADIVVAQAPSDIKYDGYIPAHQEERQNPVTGKREWVNVPASNTKEKARLSKGYLYRYDPARAEAKYKYNQHWLNLNEVFRAIDGLPETSFRGKREKQKMLDIEQKLHTDIDNYSEALDRLKQLMLLCDGCLKNGRPDRDDDIIDCAGQDKVYNALLRAHWFITH